MSMSTAIGNTVPMVNFNYTTPGMFNLYQQQPPQFQNYNQNIPNVVVSSIPNHGNMQTPPEESGLNHYMPNFHGHVQNSANIPFRNPSIPVNINQYHNVPPINLSEQNYLSKPPPERQNHQNRNPTSNHHSPHRSDKKFFHRDGHGWGGGGGGGFGGGGSVGNSPAISALALLGFLFFLNLIQNSLQNNRMMLTTNMTTTTTTTNMTTTTTAGGSTTTTLNGRSGRERRKRDSDYYSLHRYIPDSIPSHPIRPIQHFLENKEFSQPTFYQPITRDSTFDFTSPSSTNYDSMDHYDNTNSKISDSTRMNTWMPLMKHLQRISTNCYQLFACTLGRGIIKKYGKPTALMLRSIGRQLLPNTQTHWSKNILRALTNGWKIGRKCSMQYNKCAGDWDQWLSLDFSQHHKHKPSRSVKMKN